MMMRIIQNIHRAMKIHFFLITGVLLSFFACHPNHEENVNFSVISPGQKVKVEFLLNSEGQPAYMAWYEGKTVLDTSKLGFQLNEMKALDHSFNVVSVNSSTYDNTWEQPWGEEHFIRNHYRQLTVHLQEATGPHRKMNIIFRAFDDGLGFRYEFPEQDSLKDFQILDELTEFNMTDNHEAWWIPAYAGNRYEYLFKKSPIDDLERVHTPLTLETTDGLYLSIHEAALLDYSSMVIKATGNHQLKCDLVPWSKTNPVKCYEKTPAKTPWRTIQMAEKPGDLITSYLILNLNDPNKLGDVSWVKPAKYVGIWWEMHLGLGTWGRGPHHAATTANTKKYIDFAAQNDFDAVLVEGWNFGWDGNWAGNGKDFNFTKPYLDYDIAELSKYAKSKGVYIIGHHETGANIENYESQLEDACQFLEDHGMKAVKTGYVENGDTLTDGNYHHSQFYVRHFHKVIETAARHHVAVVAHEPIKDTGERRTWPNMLSREGARGQEYNAWSDDGGNPPSYTTIIPFTRLLAGPMDFTPGVFDIELPKPNNQVNTTLAKQLALYVVIYSPVQMACDLPKNYEGNPAFQFIRDVAVDWETTKVLNAEIGEYVTIARKDRNSDKWFLGSVTNEKPREFDIKTDFLDQGIKYNTTIYEDGENADYKTNPTRYKIEHKTVTSKNTLHLTLAPGGGTAISLVPID